MKIKNRYISVMGLLYSGSSAVFDYIRQFDGLGYMSVDESRVFINGMTILYELKKKNQEPTEKQKEDIVRRFSGDLDESLYVHAYNVIRNKRMFVGIDTVKSRKLIDKFLDRIDGVNVKEFILLARKFIDQFCSLKLIQQIRIFNNDPDACLVSSTLLFNENKAVVVYRDPCDQFVDQINHKSSYYMKGKTNEDNVVANMENAKIFIKMLNWRIGLFVRDIEFIKKYDLSRINNIHIVSFEGFIKKKKIRDDVSNFLGLSNPVFKTFFLE